MPPLSGQQQPPKVATDLRDGGEQKGGPAGARGSMPAASSIPVEQLLGQEKSEPRLSGESTSPTAASKMELSLLSAGDDESSSTEPGISTAAAEAASAKQLVCEMQAQIAALDMEKTQLSAQLSAAHSRIQELREAEAAGTASAVMLGTAAEEDAGQQRQLASEVTKVHRMAFSNCVFMNIYGVQIKGHSKTFVVCSWANSRAMLPSSCYRKKQHLIQSLSSCISSSLQLTMFSSCSSS